MTRELCIIGNGSLYQLDIDGEVYCMETARCSNDKRVIMNCPYQGNREEIFKYGLKNLVIKKCMILEDKINED